MGRFIDRYEPDAALLSVSSYWFTWESVPLKLRRRLGPVGKPLASAGFKAAETPWISGNRTFETCRHLALRLIGGETHFTPDEVIDRIEAAIRVIIAHESLPLVVRGPISPIASGGAKSLVRAKSRWRTVHDGLEGICRELHVTYVPMPETIDRKERPELFQSDGVHVAAAALRDRGLILGQAFVHAMHAPNPRR